MRGVVLLGHGAAGHLAVARATVSAESNWRDHSRCTMAVAMRSNCKRGLYLAAMTGKTMAG